MRATEQKTHGVNLTHRLDKKQMQEANFYRKDKFPSQLILRHHRGSIRSLLTILNRDSIQKQPRKDRA